MPTANSLSFNVEEFQGGQEQHGARSYCIFGQMEVSKICSQEVARQRKFFFPLDGMRI